MNIRYKKVKEMFRRRCALLTMTNRRALKRIPVILSVQRSETAEGSQEKKIIIKIRDVSTPLRSAQHDNLPLLKCTPVILSVQRSETAEGSQEKKIIIKIRDVSTPLRFAHHDKPPCIKAYSCHPERAAKRNSRRI